MPLQFPQIRVLPLQFAYFESCHYNSRFHGFCHFLRLPHGLGPMCRARYSHIVHFASVHACKRQITLTRSRASFVFERVELDGGDTVFGGTRLGGAPSAGDMAGFRPRGSPMMLAGGSPIKGTSWSASRCKAAGEGEPIPLIECPQCGIRVIKLCGKQADTFNCIFYKCPNNFPVSWTICIGGCSLIVLELQFF